MEIELRSLLSALFPPIFILFFSRHITAQIRAALYFSSLTSGIYLVANGVSATWALAFIFCSVSTILLFSMTCLLTPLQIPLLLPLLHKTLRDSEDMGILDRDIVMPPTKGPEIEVDIIAVNGLGAHPDLTWKAEADSQTARSGAEKKYVSWLHDYLPRDAETARIIPFRQNSSYLVNAPVKTIEDCAQQLLNAIESVRSREEEQTRPIIFVGHSFGGIVIKQAIVLAEENDPASPRHAIFRSTSGIIFLGTPHDGTWPSTLGSFIARCTWRIGGASEILDHLGFQSTKLRDLNEKFSAIFRGNTVCFYETYKTLMYHLVPILVVDSHSASLNRNDNINEPLETDHSRMNKFATKDYNYTRVVSQITRLISIAMEKDPEGSQKFHDALISGLGDNASLTHGITVPVGNTCDWAKPVVNEFISDPEQRSKALFIYGGPGLGKSVLSRFIVKHLEDDENVTVSHLIFKEGSIETSQPIPAMRRLLCELLRKNPKFYRHVRERLKKSPTLGKPWNLEDLFEIFNAIMLDERSKSVIVVIDGLNECDDEAQKRQGSKKEFRARRDLIDKFRLLRNCNGRFIITTQEFDGLSRGFSITKRIDLNSQVEVGTAVRELIDHRVNVFLDEYLQKLRDDASSDESDFSGDEESRNKRDDARDTQRTRLYQEYQNLRSIILKELKQKAGNMFLWVDLFMERLEGLQTTSPAQFRRELEGLPTDLIQLYVEMFTRKLKGNRQAITQKLPWLLFTRKPLKREELRDALAMQDFKKRSDSASISQYSFEQFRVGNLEDDLKKCFGSLVFIERSSHLVQFFHSSLRGALLGKNKPPSPELMQICKDAKDEHAEIAITCLSYICFPQFGFTEMETTKLADLESPEDGVSLEEKFPFLVSVMEEYPFLEYAARNWAYHARAAGEDNAAVVRALDRLTKLPNNLELAFQIFVRHFAHIHGKEIDLTHKLSEWGLEKWTIARIESGASFGPNEFGDHILHSAAWNGLLDLVKALESRGVDLALGDGIGQTALHHAAQAGQLEMVNFLIARGLDVNGYSTVSTDRRGWTPICFAAHQEQLEVIKALLDAGASASAAVDGAPTPRALLGDLDYFASQKLGPELDEIMRRLERLERLEASA
ncbi:hypothetical protein F4777DRAFT_422921 [Nemania sp. FL0916]|nr:hypothetical protein F4777DRAFT_422921 [Nemania sp. FL0916]